MKRIQIAFIIEILFGLMAHPGSQAAPDLGFNLLVCSKFKMTNLM
jgi:hypothetical protein